MKNSAFLVFISLTIISCEKEICLDKEPITSCTIDNFLGEWELLGFADSFPEDACLSLVEKKTGDQEETLNITLTEDDTKKRIYVSTSTFDLIIRYSVSNCETIGANLITDTITETAFTSNYVLKTEDILEYHSRFFFVKIRQVYRRKQ